jgi:hypothetical protein
MVTITITRALRVSAIIAAAAVVGCCGADEPFRDCSLDKLSGSWRISYRETNGNCGPISDETVNFSNSGAGQATSSCTTQAYSIATNKCRVDEAFTCPTTDGKGSQAWTVVVQQTSAAGASGTATVQLTHPTYGTCRSTYALTWTKL